MIPKLIAIGALCVLAPVAWAAESPEGSDDDHVALVCNGFMLVEGQAPPGSQIEANGFIDFHGMRIRGLGIGSAPIVSVTAETVRFGASLLKTTDRGHSVDGTIDRLSGETLIFVRSAKTPRTTLIAMELDCRPTRHAGH